MGSGSLIVTAGWRKMWFFMSNEFAQHMFLGNVWHGKTLKMKSVVYVGDRRSMGTSVSNAVAAETWYSVDEFILAHALMLSQRLVKRSCVASKSYGHDSPIHSLLNALSCSVEPLSTTNAIIFKKNPICFPQVLMVKMWECSMKWLQSEPAGEILGKKSHKIINNKNWRNTKTPPTQ